MSAFWYSTVLQWKMDLRSKEVLLVYYIVPLVFFAFIGGVFTSINPEAYKALIPTMTVFSVSMGALIGAPAPLSETYGGEVKRAYQVGGIPLWSPVLTHILSGTVHLMLVSLILFLIAPMAFGAEIPGNLPSYFSLLFLFILASLSIGCALGLWVKNPSKLTMFSQFLFLPSLCFRASCSRRKCCRTACGSSAGFFPPPGATRLSAGKRVCY